MSSHNKSLINESEKAAEEIAFILNNELNKGLSNDEIDFTVKHYFDEFECEWRIGFFWKNRWLAGFNHRFDIRVIRRGITALFRAIVLYDAEKFADSQGWL